jgi:hypothetical protein
MNERDRAVWATTTSSDARRDVCRAHVPRALGRGRAAPRPHLSFELPAPFSLLLRHRSAPLRGDRDRGADEGGRQREAEAAGVCWHGALLFDPVSSLFGPAEKSLPPLPRFTARIGRFRLRQGSWCA